MRRLLLALGLSATLLGCGADPLPSARAPLATGPDASASAANGGNVVAGGPTVSNDAPNPNGSWVGTAAGSDAFVAGPQDTFVAVWVDVPRDDAKVTAPAAVSLVIDTSGSMAGDKIKHARVAAERLVSELRDGDIVSLHTFSDRVEERFAPARLDATARRRLASILAELRADGGTNLFEGVRLGGLSAMGAPLSHPVRRVVLISDGQATVGMTSPVQLANLGEKAGDRGVQLTAIGVGLDYDEKTLNQLALRSSGRLYHLTDTRALPEIIGSEVSLLKATRATGARVAIVPAPGVRLLGVDGARGTFNSEGAIEVPLGAMFAGQHREFIVRARVTAPDAGSHPIASVRLLFADPAENNLERVQEAIARFDVVNDPRVALERKNQRAHNVLAMIETSLVTETAAQSINSDDFDGAEQQLAQAEERLRRQAGFAGSAKEKKRLEESADRLGSTRKSAKAASQAPAPARAAAKRDSALKANDAALDMMGL